MRRLTDVESDVKLNRGGLLEHGLNALADNVVHSKIHADENFNQLNVIQKQCVFKTEFLKMFRSADGIYKQALLFAIRKNISAI